MKLVQVQEQKGNQLMLDSNHNMKNFYGLDFQNKRGNSPWTRSGNLACIQEVKKSST